MTKDKAMMIQDRINNGDHNMFLYTAVRATIEEYMENEFEIDVKPDTLNEGNSFHHIDLIADIARGFGVSTYASIVDDVIHVRLF